MKQPITNLDYFIYYSLWIFEQTLLYVIKIPQNRSLKHKYSNYLISKLHKLPVSPIKNVDTFNEGELSEEDFIKNYVKPGKPVVIKGIAKEWKCCKEWSLEFFNKKYGEELLPFLETNSDKYIYNEAPLSRICDEISMGSTNYAKFSGLIIKFPELLNYFDKSYIRSSLAIRHIESSVQLFIGGRNSATNIHTAISNVSFIQVHGKKEWLTLPKSWTPILNPVVDTQPQFMAHSFFNNLDENSRNKTTERMPFIRVKLEAGDFFFNPAYTWHSVKNTSTSIGVAFRWVPYRAILQSPIMTTLVALKQLSFVSKMTNHTKGQYFPSKWP
jgi:hypothetical protein